MDALTLAYARAWAQLPMELVELVVVPAPRSPDDDPAPRDDR